MLELDQDNAEAYLRDLGWVDRAERLAVHALAGGVSGQVLYVSRPDRPGEDFVLKQARPQLRTAIPWFSNVERIWREVEVLRICQELLKSGQRSAVSDQLEVLRTPNPELRTTTPRILHEDRDEYAFAMSAAPRDHHVWKRDLLAGQVRPEIAGACGRLLGRLQAGAWHDEDVRRRIGDRTLFHELRIDPYYRTLIKVHPAAAPRLEALIDSVANHACTLVHADFTPKNLLVYDGGLMMVDFETGHFGDPAFDLGLFLTHLALKAAHQAPKHAPYLELTRVFWDAYRAELAPVIVESEYAALTARAVQNFVGCMWARLDGTSGIDYLHDPARREVVRRFCQDVLGSEVATWDAVLAEFEPRLAAMVQAVAGEQGE